MGVLFYETPILFLFFFFPSPPPMIHAVYHVTEKEKGKKKQGASLYAQ
jgi:hypothetical protein